MRVLCLYVSLPEEITQKTVDSIRNQTLPVDRIIMVTERSNKKTLCQRVSEVINNALRKEELEKYDFILRVDSDVVLPNDFLEKNLSVNPDIMGFGSAQIIKVKPFLKLMGGQLHPDQDDTYIRHKFISRGLAISKPVVEPKRLRKSGSLYSTVDYHLFSGEMQYRLGYEPIHVIFNFKPNPKFLWKTFGYFGSLFRRKEKFDTASFAFWSQIKTLKNPSKMMAWIHRKRQKPCFLQC